MRLYGPLRRPIANVNQRCRDGDEAAGIAGATLARVEIEADLLLTKRSGQGGIFR